MVAGGGAAVWSARCQLQWPSGPGTCGTCVGVGICECKCGEVQHHDAAEQGESRVLPIPKARGRQSEGGRTASPAAETFPRLRCPGCPCPLTRKSKGSHPSSSKPQWQGRAGRCPSIERRAAAPLGPEAAAVGWGVGLGAAPTCVGSGHGRSSRLEGGGAAHAPRRKQTVRRLCG